MAEPYRIRRWSEHFETADTRKRHGLEWIKLPIRLNGMSYRRIAARKDGAAVLGVWMVLLEVAAQQRMPRDGTLVDGDGRPYTTADLSLCTGLSEPVIANAITVLESEGWVESAGGLPDPGRNLPQSAARGEETRGEERRGELSSAGADGLALWNQNCEPLPKARTASRQRATRLRAFVKEAGEDAPAAIRTAASDPFYRERRYGIDTFLRHWPRFVDAARNGEAVKLWTPEDGL